MHNIMKRTLSIVSIMLLTLCGIAQGNLDVRQDSRINDLIEKQGKLYAIDSTMSGFRVQIFMEVGNDAIDHAEITKREFERQFKGIPVYLSYGQPYYRLRVGDFRNRVEAEKCLREIKGRYTNAFVTADNIYPPKTQSDEPLKPFVIDEDAEETGESMGR